MAQQTPTVVTSVTKALNVMGMGRGQWMLLGYTAFAWAADACETMLLSFLGPSAACAWPDEVTPAKESALTSVVFIGMLVGVNSLGVTADALGRRKGFFLSAILLGAAGLASAAAPSFGWLLVIRCIVGVALGGAPIVITLFAEWIPSTSRGSFLLVQQGAWTLGTVLQALLAWVVLPSLGWRWLLVMSAAPMMVLLAAYPLIPESPYWLVAKGRHKEAEAAVEYMASWDDGIKTPAVPRRWIVRFEDENRGGNSISNDNDIADINGLGDVERGDIERSSGVASASGLAHGAWHSRLSTSIQITFHHIFSPRLAKTTSLVWGIWFVNAITYYGLVLLTTTLQTHQDGKEKCTPDGHANFTPRDFSAVLLVSAAEAPGLVLAAMLVDSKGRIWCLRWGYLLCSACVLALLAVSSNAAQVALLFAARAAIGGTFCVLYVYTPELYPTAIRAFALALCNAFSRFGGLAAPFVTVYLVEEGRIGTAVGLLSVLCLGAATAASLLPYETRGRDLNAVCFLDARDEINDSGNSSGGDLISTPGASIGSLFDAQEGSTSTTRSMTTSTILDERRPLVTNRE